MIIKFTIIVAGISFNLIKFVLFKKSIVVATTINENGHPDIMLFSLLKKAIMLFITQQRFQVMINMLLYSF
jgi:hypothetical protein